MNPIDKPSAPGTRRAHTRVPYECPVVLTASEQVWKGHTKNISEGGIYVSTFVPPQVDTVVSIALHLTGGQSILHLHGGVCWTRGVMGSVEGEPPGCGISFLSPGERELAVLRSILTARHGVEDRRTHARAPFRVEVTLSSTHNFYTGIANDISEGGVFVATPTPPERGSVVSLRLSLPRLAEPVTIQGEVRWTRSSDDGGPAGCGIRWITLPPHVADAIRRFVEQRTSLFFEDT